MTKRPYVCFAEVKEKIPIPEALEVLGIISHFNRKNDILTGSCPLPNHKHGPNPNTEQFKINRKHGVWLWHCFGDCQKGGDVIELVKEMTGYDDAHVRFWFAENFGDRLTSSKQKSNSKAENDTAHQELGQELRPRAAVIAALATSASPAQLRPLRFRLNLDPAVPYLHKRGLADETIARYGLGLCQRGVLKGYVAIPVFGWPQSDDSNPLAYLGRWPGDDHDEASGRPRYKWPEGFLKSQVVYGLREALADTGGQPLIVVEGPFKVYHLVQAGFPATVAVLGSSLSDEQAAVLISTDRPIVLMFDGNEAGQAGMRAAAGKLITRTFVRVAKLPEGKEPDHLDRDALAQLLP